MQKKQLRKHYLTLRRNFQSSQKQQADKNIEQFFFDSPLAQKNSFFIYLDFDGEPSTANIITRLVEQGKSVFVPKIIKNRMFPVLYGGEMQKNPFGIYEPKHEILADKPPEVALVPLLAADRRGVRLGYGKGYYDTYLNGKNIIKAGLLYSFLIADKLPEEAHDIRLDMLICQNGIINLLKG